MTSGHPERHPLKEKRRANKPLLERKRRARINDSLRDLKYLVLSTLNKDVSKFAKMEKVDILDMTVQFLKGRRVDQQNDDYAALYRAGFSDCANDVIRLVMGMEGVDSCAKTKILVNLAQSCQSVHRSSPPPSPTPSVASVECGSIHSPVPSPTASPSKPVPSFFGSAASPLLETSRQVILTNAPVPHDRSVLYSLQPEAAIARTRLNDGFVQRTGSCSPVASVKPIARLPLTSNSIFDMRSCEKEQVHILKSNVWRPW